MGESILEKIPRLIDGLLRKSNTWELIDFLPFLGQLIHKFKVILQLNSLMCKAEDTRSFGRIDGAFIESNL